MRTSPTNTRATQKSDGKFNREEEIKKMLVDKKRHIQIIGLWIKEKPLYPENKQQLKSIIKRNVRPAKLLEGYRNEDIRETIKILKRTPYIQKFTIETITKFIDEVITNKKKQRKIIRWERKGNKMKPIFN